MCSWRRLEAAIALLSVGCLLARGEFTSHFHEFLVATYGRDRCASLERLDMGTMMLGSFGGKNSAADTINRRPLILVHGAMLRAGTFLEHRRFFLERGYSSGELYATTYSDGGLTPLMNKKLDCKDVKLVSRASAIVAF